MSGSNPLAVALGQVGQTNPLQFAQGYANLATSAQQLKTSQFDLLQKQQGLGYDAMRRLYATNPNPTNEDIQAALGEAARMGGNVDGIVSNLTAFTARGGTPSDFVRGYTAGGMAPENQMTTLVGQPQIRDTGAAIVSGMMGGAASKTPGQFTPTGYIQRTLTPAEASEPFTIQTPQGTFVTNRGNMVGGGAATGGAPTGAPPPGGGVGVGGSALLPPNAAPADQEARLQAIMQRESGGQNINNRQGPGGAPLSSASGYYQMIDSTWQHAAQLAGINTQQYPRAIDAPYNLQHAAALALMNEQGERPWATSAPGGGGAVAAAPGGAQGGPFIGTTSAQPVVGGGAGAQPGAGPGGNVRPAGGVQGYDAYGRPLGAGGGGGGGAPQIPGVTYTPGGGYVIRPTSPYEQPQLEQSSKDYVADQVTNRTLSRRIAPLQQAIGIINSNPGLVTGPSSENWYQWVQGIAAATGIDVGDVHNANAYQELAKQLAMNLQQSGADPTDMARLMHEASQPNTTQGRQAIVTLAAEQIGYQRLKSAQYLEFRSRHPSDANTNAQFYNQETGDWASQQDPMAYAADQLPRAELQRYLSTLDAAGKKRFADSLQNASRLFNFKGPPQQGGQNGR